MSLKPISISLSPNTEKDDVRLAFSLLWQPWKWREAKRSEAKPHSDRLEDEFKKYLGVNFDI